MAREVLAYSDYKAGKVKDAGTNSTPWPTIRIRPTPSRAAPAPLPLSCMAAAPPITAPCRRPRRRPRPARRPGQPRPAPRHERSTDRRCRFASLWHRCTPGGLPIPWTRSAAGSARPTNPICKGERISLLSTDEAVDPRSRPGRHRRRAAARPFTIPNGRSRAAFPPTPPIIWMRRGRCANLGCRCRQGLGLLFAPHRRTRGRRRRDLHPGRRSACLCL